MRRKSKKRTQCVFLLALAPYSFTRGNIDLHIYDSILF